MVSVFFSYSHRDESFRDELEIHLAMLKREGVVDTWHDRRIGAGSDVKGAISEHLEDANIILLLVSPYFLASDYCYDVEMSRALERHQSGEARVIPIILQPCDWKRAPFGKLRACPPDGKPIAKYPNVHDAYLVVVEDIRGSALELARSKGTREEPPAAPQEAATQGTVVRAVRSSNLRIKRSFTDKEKDDFLDSAFEYVANIFENSLSELATRNAGAETRFKRLDPTHFTASVYIQGRARTQCRVWVSARARFFSGIGYSASDSGDDNSFNEVLSVTDDGYTQLFRAQMNVLHGARGQDQMTIQGAAEHLWELFVRPLQ